MIWLGAAPPPSYEYLAPTENSHTLVGQEGIFKHHRLSRNIIFFILLSFWVIGFGWLTRAVSSAEISNPSGNFPTYFPSMQQIIIYYGDRLVSGPMFMSMGGVLGILYLISRKLEKGQQKELFSVKNLKAMRPIPPLMLLLVGIGFAGIGSIHFIAAYSEAATDLLLRFDPTQVTEITVERLDQRSQCPQLTINDKTVIREGVSQLTKAHEIIDVARVWFSEKGGYLIHLEVSGSSLHYRYLLIHKYMRDGQPVQAVAPFFSIPSNPRLAFKSSEFHEWIAKNIDPYFEECPLEN
jgi:hypothetical protein